MLSIVLITYNSRSYIQACLDSIFRQDVNDVEVIVVDNASTDGTREFVQTMYAQAKLIANSANLGASKARNQGIECAVGEWVLTLDSDVVLGDGFLQEFLLAPRELSDDIGMVQTNILNIDGKTIHSQGIYLSVIRRFFDLNRGKPQDFVDPEAKRILGPCSAAAFYRRSMLEELKEPTGYFDERFFFLVEDVDLAWRARRAGWKVVLCRQLTCFHTGNGSGTNKMLRQYLSFRNRYLMIGKNERFLGKVMVYMLSLPYEAMRIIYLACSNKYLWVRRSG